MNVFFKSELRTGRLHVRGLTFSLSEKHQNFRKKCFEFAESELKPLAPTIDKEHRYPREHVSWKLQFSSRADICLPS